MAMSFGDPVNSSDEATDAYERKFRIGDLRMMVVVATDDDDRVQWLDELCAAVRAEAVAPLEALLRRVTRPRRDDRDALALDAAKALAEMGFTCTSNHIGPFFHIPGSDAAERCITCGQAIGK